LAEIEEIRQESSGMELGILAHGALKALFIIVCLKIRHNVMSPNEGIYIFYLLTDTALRTL